MRICVAVAFGLMAVATGCNDRGARSHTTVRSPDGHLSLAIEKTDRGSCCTSSIVAEIANFPENPAMDGRRIFEIRGSTDTRLQWNGPHTIRVLACDATSISHESGLHNADLSKRIFVTVVNLQPVRTPDGLECSFGNVPGAVRL